MNEIWDVVKLLLFGVFLFVRYEIALFVFVNAAVRFLFGFCRSRSKMAVALLLTLPITAWNFGVQIQSPGMRDGLLISFGFLALIGAGFWLADRRKLSGSKQRIAIDILIAIGVVLFWSGILIGTVMKNGLIAH